MRPVEIREELQAMYARNGLEAAYFDNEFLMTCQWDAEQRAYRYPDNTFTYAFVIRSDLRGRRDRRRFRKLKPCELERLATRRQMEMGL